MRGKGCESLLQNRNVLLKYGRLTWILWTAQEECFEWGWRSEKLSWGLGGVRKSRKGGENAGCWYYLAPYGMTPIHEERQGDGGGGNVEGGKKNCVFENWGLSARDGGGF